MGDHQHNNPTVSLREQTVLVVENDQEIGQAFVEILRRESPYEVVLVHDGFQALELMKSIIPSLIVADHWLPGMDGIEFYVHLKSIKAFADIPILLISAHLPTAETLPRNLPYLWKPFDMSMLLHKVRILLS